MKSLASNKLLIQTACLPRPRFPAFFCFYSLVAMVTLSQGEHHRSLEVPTAYFQERKLE
jgi:hypothetical protein